MKIEKNRSYLTIAIYTFVTAVAIIISYLVLSNLKGFGSNFSSVMGVFTPFILGIAIAYVLNPLMMWIERQLSRIDKLNSKKRLKRTLAVSSTLLFFLAVLYSFFALVLPTVSQSIGLLLTNLSTYYNNMETAIYTFATQHLGEINLTDQQINSFIDSLITEFNKGSALISQLLPKTINIIVGFTTQLTNIVIAIIVTIYFLAGKETFLAQVKKTLYAFTNTAKSQYTMNLADKANKIFNGYVSASLLDALVIGILTFITLCIFDIEYAALISLIVGVTNIIPFLGPFIGAIPSAILLLLVDPKQCLIFIVIIIVVQQLDANVIKPKILGQSTGLSSFWVIFAVFVSGKLFGAIGMFVGVPVFAVIYVLFKELVENKLNKKSLSPNTIDYREDLDHTFPVQGRLKKDKAAPKSADREENSQEPTEEASTPPAKTADCTESAETDKSDTKEKSDS